MCLHCRLFSLCFIYVHCIFPITTFPPYPLSHLHLPTSPLQWPRCRPCSLVLFVFIPARTPSALPISIACQTIEKILVRVQSNIRYFLSIFQMYIDIFLSCGPFFLMCHPNVQHYSNILPCSNKVGISIDSWMVKCYLWKKFFRYCSTMNTARKLWPLFMMFHSCF